MLHNGILNAPQYWKTKVLVDSSKQLTSKTHFPNVRENLQRRAIFGCKSCPRTYWIMSCSSLYKRPFQTISYRKINANF